MGGWAASLGQNRSNASLCANSIVSSELTPKWAKAVGYTKQMLSGLMAILVLVFKVCTAKNDGNTRLIHSRI